MAEGESEEVEVWGDARDTRILDRAYLPKEEGRMSQLIFV